MQSFDFYSLYLLLYTLLRFCQVKNALIHCGEHNTNRLSRHLGKGGQKRVSPLIRLSSCIVNTNDSAGGGFNTKSHYDPNIRPESKSIHISHHGYKLTHRSGFVNNYFGLK